MKQLTKVHMTQDKTTPGTYRYANDNHADGQMVTSIYLRKDGFGPGVAVPGDITLTIEVDVPGED